VYDTIMFSTATCKGANTINSVLDYFWPWDNCTNGFERYTALYTVNPTYNCPADSRTLQVNGSAYESGSWAFTAYEGVRGPDGYCYWYQGQISDAASNYENTAFPGSGADFANAVAVALTYYDTAHNNDAGAVGILRNSNKFDYSFLEGNIYAKSVAFRGARISDITDGTSNTLLVGERPPNSSMDAGVDACGTGDVILGVTEINFRNSGYDFIDACAAGPYQYGPGNINNPCDMFHYWSLHSGGGNWLYADASVHFLPYTTASQILQVMSTYNGGETFTQPQ
jgi:prepilin-type processing-associated H-X9-DG protein